ncbi:MAG: hypothetical protein BRC31_09130 [Actinobacteria bacterium QS_5_72_10]|nr:MAG: hypothetical protein BRC31_09130 [Actinobacteria bacterium QS_5_72_10]
MTMIDPLQLPVVFKAASTAPDSVVADIVVPLGILVFFGTTYVLLRANLGTKRGYLVMATTFFGFMMLFSLFWGFGGWGTPQAKGPTQLPGQPVGALDPTWRPFAQDSQLAQQPDYQLVQDYPEGFQTFEGASGSETMAAVEEALKAGELEAAPAIRDSLSLDLDEPMALLEQAVDDSSSFFSQDEVSLTIDGEEMTQRWSNAPIQSQWEPTEIGLTTNNAGEVVMAMTFQEVGDNGEVVADGETYTAFAFYDQGAPLMPSFVFFFVALILFALHGWLLDRDERLERREREQLERQLEEAERVPEPA